MDFKCLSSSIVLFALLIPCWTLVNTNPSQPLLPQGNRVSPLPAPAVYSMDRQKNQIFGIKEMRRNILEYLTYKEFGTLNGVSSSWHSIMAEELSDKKNPLILPTDIKLVAYIHRCFDRIPKPQSSPSGTTLSLTDELNTESSIASSDVKARLAIVNNLITLCNRSYYPGTTLMNASRLYNSLVPNDEKLVTFGSQRNVRLSRCIQDFDATLGQLSYLEQQDMKDARDDEKKDDKKLNDEQPTALNNDQGSMSAPINGQLKQELQQKLKSIKQQLLPLFIRWRPYGVLSKLALLFKTGIIGHASTEFKNWFLKNPINLLIAPELCDIELLASDDKSCFMQSEKCYQGAITTHAQHLANMVKRHSFLRKRDGLPYGAYEPLTRTPVEPFERDLQLYWAMEICHLDKQIDRETNLDAKNTLIRKIEQMLLQLDQLTNGEFAIREILDPSTAWNAERLGRRTAPLSELFKCLESIVYSDNLFYEFNGPAAFCDKIAWLSNDPGVQEKYLKKAVFFWDKSLENIGNNAKLNRLNLIRDAMLTYYRASQSITDPRERARCYRTAVILKWFAALDRLLHPKI